MASSDALKKPQTAYFLWMNANRERIQKLAGAKDFKTVAAKASELWKSAASAEKAPFEKEAEKQKKAYDAYISTEAGQKALQEKKAEKKDEKQAKQEKEADKAKKKEEKAIAREKRDCKAAVKAVEKDEKLKKPMSAYFMWLNDNRERITAMVGGKGGPEVTKKGSEMWKKLSDTERKKYDNRAAEAKADYDAYIATPEGSAALQAYKEATDAVSFKEKIMEAAGEDENQKPAQKRKADGAAAPQLAREKQQKSAKAGA